MQPTLKRLLTSKKDATKKYASILDSAQLHFCSESAKQIDQASHDYATQDAASSHALSKFTNQILLVLQSTESNAMLSQLKLALSARPVPNTILPPNVDSHPAKVILRVMIQFFFKWAPRSVIREVLRLLTFYLTVPSSEANSLALFVRSEFMTHWKLALGVVEASASLSLPQDPSITDATMLENIDNTIYVTDLLWSVFLSPLPSILPLLSDENDSKDAVLCFFARVMQLVSRDQQQIDTTKHRFSLATIESLLGALHAFLKLVSIKERVGEHYFMAIKAAGLDPEVTIEQLWNADSTAKIAAATLPTNLDPRYTLQRPHIDLGSSAESMDESTFAQPRTDYVRIVGALFHGSIALLASRFCSKDTTHSAGLLAAMLASDFLVAVGRQFPSWTQAQIVVSFWPSLATGSAKNFPTALNTLPTGPRVQENDFPSHTFSAEFLESLPQPAQISLLRGVIICFSSDIPVLTAPCAALPGISLEDPNVRSRSSNDLSSMSAQSAQSDKFQASSILFDAALPWFIKFSETSCERYARFLAVKSSGACVEFLIKALDSIMPSEGATSSSSANVLGYLKIKVETSMERLLELIWKNWEDPFDSIVSEICSIFPLLLEAGEKAFKVFGPSQSLGADFCDKLALHLLNVDLATKGKYPLLLMLIQRVGAQHLLSLKPSFLNDLLVASNFAIAGRAVGPVINAFLTSIHGVIKTASSTKKEKKTSSRRSTKDKGVETTEVAAPTTASTLGFDPVQLITLPLLPVILSEDTLIPITLYALPSVFELFPDCFKQLIQKLICINGDESKLVTKFDTTRTKAVLSVLKVARASGLIEPSHFTTPRFFDSNQSATDGLLMKLVQESLVSNDIDLRLDALQLLVETRKTSELPTSLELNSMTHNLDFNMLETNLVYRNRSLNMMDQLLLRFKDSIKAQHKLPSRSLELQQEAIHDVNSAIEYLNAISGTLLHYLYVPAPPHRRFTSLEGLKTLVTKFGPEPQKGSNFLPYVDLALSEEATAATASGKIPQAQIAVTDKSDKWKSLKMFSPAATLSLLVGLWDQYDSGRILSFEVLKAYPSPLPGFETPNALVPFVRWALASVSSPRMRDADSGSLALRLLASSYIVRAGWELRLSLEPIQGKSNSVKLANIQATPPQSSTSHKESTIERIVTFCNDILDIVMVHVTETRKDRHFAAMHFPVHGPLMAVRYIINDVNLSSLDEASKARWRSLVLRMMNVAKTVSVLALELKYPLRYTHNAQGEVDHSKDHADENGEDDENIDMAQLAAQQEKDVTTPQSEQSDSKKPQSESNSTTEGVLVAMWLSLKEVSFLLGCLVKSTISAASAESSRVSSTHSSLSLTFMTEDEIKMVGQHLFDSLLVLRHRGAMETTAEGFQLICESILQTNDRNLHLLVHDWLAQLLNRIDNTPWALLSTRRSAGLPYAFLAILRSENLAAERNRSSRKMLPIVFSHLYETASRKVWTSQPMLTSTSVVGEADREAEGEAHSSGSTVRTPSTDADVGMGHESNHSPKEHRHQVHALNVIRAIIRDRSIVDDVSPFVEPVLTLVLTLYLSPHWAVQNAATMSFSTLLERTSGGSRFANTTSAESASKEDNPSKLPPGASVPRLRAPKITADGFFTRYPIAQSFLLSSLSRETKLVKSATGEASQSSSGPKLDSVVDHILNGIQKSHSFPSKSQLMTRISQTLQLSSKSSSDAGSSTEQIEESASSSLYAILLLLSRMSPSKTLAPRAQEQIAPFIYLTCSAALSSTNAMVRSLAAQAVAPLIPTPLFTQFLSSFIESLPSSKESYAQRFSATSGGSNQLHGLLLLIWQVLRTHTNIIITGAQQAHSGDSNEDGQSDASIGGSFAASCVSLLEQLRDSVLPALAPKLWLLRLKNAPISSVLLSIVSEFVIQPLCADTSLIAQHSALSSFANMSATLCSLLLKRRLNEKSTTSSGPVQAVMRNVMLHHQYKLATSIVANSLLGLSAHTNLSKAFFASNAVSQTSVQSTIEALLISPDYEVRLQTHKVLAKSIRSSHLSLPSLTTYLLSIIGFLESSIDFIETHPKCTLRIVRLLNLLGAEGALNHVMESTAAGKVLQTLQSWAFYQPYDEHTTSRLARDITDNAEQCETAVGVSTSLRQESLIFLAFYLRIIQPSAQASEEEVSKFSSSINWWLAMVERHSRYELATPDREAAALSLARFPLEFHKLSTRQAYSKVVIDYWMLMIRLLQDDEGEIRERARTVVSGVMASERAACITDASESASSNITVVLEPGLMNATAYCYDSLSKHFGSHPHYWKWLLLGLCPDVASCLELGPGPQPPVDWHQKLAFSSQLFEQEKANFFHEIALIAQFSRRQLLAIVSSKPSILADTQIASMVKSLRGSLEVNLFSLSQVLQARKPDPLKSSVSSLTAEWQFMYENVFTSTYSVLIALKTISEISPATPLSDAVLGATAALTHMEAGVLHPVLFEAATSVHRSSSAHPGDSSGTRVRLISSPVTDWANLITTQKDWSNFLLA